MLSEQPRALFETIKRGQMMATKSLRKKTPTTAKKPTTRKATAKKTIAKKAATHKATAKKPTARKASPRR